MNLELSSIQQSIFPENVRRRISSSYCRCFFHLPEGEFVYKCEPEFVIHIRYEGLNNVKQRKEKFDCGRNREPNVSRCPEINGFDGLRQLDLVFTLTNWISHLFPLRYFR